MMLDAKPRAVRSSRARGVKMMQETTNKLINHFMSVRVMKFAGLLTFVVSCFFVLSETAMKTEKVNRWIAVKTAWSSKSVRVGLSVQVPGPVFGSFLFRRK